MPSWLHNECVAINKKQSVMADYRNAMALLKLH